MIISKTPLRCSFFGGGTDFRQYYENASSGFGCVLSTALNMHVYITVNKKFDDKIRLCYAGNELVDSVEEVRHNIIREALKLTGVTRSIEIVYQADIPLSTAGVGLASSSALAVGVLNALHAYKGEYVRPDQLAREAAHIEIDLLGQRIGIQDQFAVAFGGFNRYRFHRAGNVTVEPVLASHATLQTLWGNLLLFFTGLTRDSRQILNEQQQSIAQKMAMLDEVAQMVDNAWDALAQGDPDRVGAMLDEAWQRKKRFAQGVSTPLIDAMYGAARQAGALGGKILGAGGGGFLLVYAAKDKQPAVREALSQYREIPFVPEGQGSHIVFAD
ncbi:MAG TPA: GHMP kinase [Candidatus Aphodomonas merdavium]|nr:GHMP kinase [Candidatus Aphodomonas merdavium]